MQALKPGGQRRLNLFFDSDFPAGRTANTGVATGVVGVERQAPHQPHQVDAIGSPTGHNSLHNISYRTLRLPSGYRSDR